MKIRWLTILTFCLISAFTLAAAPLKPQNIKIGAKRSHTFTFKAEKTQIISIKTTTAKKEKLLVRVINSKGKLVVKGGSEVRFKSRKAEAYNLVHINDAKQDVEAVLAFTYQDMTE